MRTAKTIDSMLHGGPVEIACCVCGERDFDKMHVHTLGIAAGISGDDYSFCLKCWKSKTLGSKILKLVGYNPKHGMKLRDDCVSITEES